MFTIALAWGYATLALLIGLAICHQAASDLAARTLIIRLAIFTLTSQAIAFFAPNNWLYCVFVLPLIPALARTRTEVCALYVFGLATLPFVRTPFGVAGVYLSFVDAGLALAIGVGIGLLRFSRGSRPPTRVGYAILLLFLVMTITTARATSATNYLRVTAETFFVLVVPYLALAVGLRRRSDWRIVQLTLALAAVALGCLAALEAFKGWPLYRIIWERQGVSEGLAAVKIRAGLLRSPGSYPESTAFGFVLVLATILLFACRQHFRKNMFPLLVAIALLGIAATQSRGALLALIGGFVVFDLLRKAYSGLALKAFAGAAAAIISFLTLPNFTAYFLGTSDLSAGVQDYRVSLLSRGVQEFWKNPLMGAPLAEVSERMRDLTQGEGIIDFVNTYLFIGLVGGFIGLIAFVAVFAIALWQGREAVRHAGEAGVQAALVSAMLMLATTSFGSRLQSLIVVLLTLATKASVTTARGINPGIPMINQTAKKSSEFQSMPPSKVVSHQ